MATYPDNLRYTEQHEWVQTDSGGGGTESGGGDTVRVGITDFAQDALGDVVYVTLPDVGAEVRAGEPCGELESTKSVSEVYAPVSGVVLARNEDLDSAPDLLNTDPYGAGWMFEVRPADPAEAGQLLDAASYRDKVGDSGG